MKIRNIKWPDKDDVVEMMKAFYTSPAVFTNGSEEIFLSDIENCINDNPYLEGYVFEENGVLQGYSMIAKSFSTEFGKPCIWIEDLYIKSEFRGLGIAKELLDFVKKKYSNAVIRLEVEEDNFRAISVYKKGGFEMLPYSEMIRL